MTPADFQNMQGTGPFMPAVVIDYIKHPLQSDDEITDYLTYLKDTVGAVLPDGASRLKNVPRGSLIGKLINNSTTASTIFYPFFSHISMPIKAGEVVWVINNHPIGWWFSRKTTDRIAEDPNFTHGPRAIHSYLAVNKIGNERSIQQTFNKDPAQIVDYNKVFNSSKSNQESFQGEAVPRFFKPAVDLALEGSNNALVVLGSAATLGNKAPNTGMIDIVVGRGQSNNTSTSSTFNNGRNFTENDKTANIKSTEGDIDPLNDLSSVYISMNDNLDDRFDVNIGSDQGSGPSAGIRSNHVRISGRDDIKITVESDSKKIGIVIKDGGVVITNSTGVTATDVIVDGSISFQSSLARSLTEIAAAIRVFGYPVTQTDTLVNLLAQRSFSSKVTKSD